MSTSIATLAGSDDAELLAGYHGAASPRQRGRGPQDARMRIASLIASSTEIVCALGFGDDLVGRSHERDYPEWVKRLPALTEPKLPTDGTSYEIDQRIGAILQEGLTVYRVFAEKLEAVHPESCEPVSTSIATLPDLMTPSFSRATTARQYSHMRTIAPSRAILSLYCSSTDRVISHIILAKDFTAVVVGSCSLYLPNCVHQ